MTDSDGRRVGPVFLVCVVTSFALIACGKPSRPVTTAASSPAVRSYITAPPGTPPLAGSREVSLAKAERKLPYALPLPDADLANSSDLFAVYLGGHDVALVYDQKRITIFMRPYTFARSPEIVFEHNAANDPAETVSTVNGDPADVIAPNTDPDGNNPAWIEFVHDGIDINVESSTYGLDRLMPVAESMKVPPPS